MIKIEVEKIVSDNGELGFKILKIEALTKSELPDLYLGKNKPYCYLAPESGAHYDELHIFKKGTPSLDILLPTNFTQLKNLMRDLISLNRPEKTLKNAMIN